jgi:uncharacterized protein YycO
MFLEPINFPAMYKEHKATTDFKAKTSSDWDEKSADMALSTINSPYVEDFISRMNITGDDSNPRYRMRAWGTHDPFGEKS